MSFSEITYHSADLCKPRVDIMIGGRTTRVRVSYPINRPDVTQNKQGPSWLSNRPTWCHTCWSPLKCCWMWYYMYIWVCMRLCVHTYWFIAHTNDEAQGSLRKFMSQLRWTWLAIRCITYESAVSHPWWWLTCPMIVYSDVYIYTHIHMYHGLPVHNHHQRSIGIGILLFIPSTIHHPYCQLQCAGCRLFVLRNSFSI